MEWGAGRDAVGETRNWNPKVCARVGLWVHSSYHGRVGVCVYRVLLSSNTTDESYARLPLARWPVGTIAICRARLLEIRVIRFKYMPLKTGLSVACALRSYQCRPYEHL